jgi:hypothetical protein
VQIPWKTRIHMGSNEISLAVLARFLWRQSMTFSLRLSAVYLYSLTAILVNIELGGKLQLTVKVLLFCRACLATLSHNNKTGCVPLTISD